MGTTISKRKNNSDKNVKNDSTENKRQKKNEEHDSNLEFIKKYKIINKIGDGNFSKVFCCRAENKKKCAMKLMCCPLKKTSHYNCFKRELFIMKTINNKHPYIVKILDYHEKIWKKYYIVKLILEYCEGGNLFEYIKINGSCTHSEARVIIIKLTKTIQYINSLKIMHRDIKPENILLRTKDNIKSVVLSDFGLAKITPSNQAVVKSRSVCGSDFYLAPEIIKNKEYGIKIDIWSLGVLIFFIITGKVPFTGKNANELYNNILKANIPELLSKEKSLNIQPGLKNLLENILVHDPEKRFSCSDILNHRWIRGTLTSCEFKIFNSASYIKKLRLDKKRNTYDDDSKENQIKDKSFEKEKDSFANMKKKYTFFLKKITN
ncbi:serine/threonine protein kinase, putative [Plasmodium ovale]|uniref:Serine/threonine protein kinase, putative n=1 Tax=Plasmodium ovale TaxID=36330 RepID=A0A1D3TLK8_PLAOA|nr:serine/threonine protein kinase, putative [Plasmodium ovale]